MEKNQTSCPRLVCEKIFRAITLSPAFTTIRRVSNRQQTPSSAAAKHTRNPPSEVPIKFDYSTGRLPNPSPTEKPKPKTISLNGSTYTNGTASVPLVAQQAKTPKPIVPGYVQPAGSSKLKQHQGKKEEACKKPTQQHYDAKFDAFIYQTREKLRSDDHQDNGGNSQNVVGHGHATVRKDHHFSDFINQTKRKIRSTLSLKDRSESFK
ncbi:hypothetical protein HRI_001053300 [Hibiscus trionum]|uniref:Uncharacterized protein n=1 Tax=Hibiscus trionum TaxID=183268 RepID=A0A9W7HDK7_HIBTR|nr:hypothetical protein HRI_001053300 [Hibiscus trionum]